MIHIHQRIMNIPGVCWTQDEWLTHSPIVYYSLIIQYGHADMIHSITLSTLNILVNTHGNLTTHYSKKYRSNVLRITIFNSFCNDYNYERVVLNAS